MFYYPLRSDASLSTLVPLVTPFPYGDSPLKRESARQCYLNSFIAQKK